MLKHRHSARQDVCRAPGTPSGRCSIRATNPNGRRPGSRIYSVRRGLAIKASKPCKILVYLVVQPSLFHFITLKYARTLHKRRPCDARTMKCPAHDTTTSVAPRALRRAHMHAQRCKHMHAAPSEREGVRTVPKRVGWHAGGGEGGGPEGGRRVQHRPPRACEGGKGGVRLCVREARYEAGR